MDYCGAASLLVDAAAFLLVWCVFRAVVWCLEDFLVVVAAVSPEVAGASVVVVGAAVAGAIVVGAVVIGAVVVGAMVVAGAIVLLGAMVVLGAVVVVWATAGTAAPIRATVETAARNRVVKVMDVSAMGRGDLSALAMNRLKRNRRARIQYHAVRDTSRGKFAEANKFLMEAPEKQQNLR